jgi:hypothetical protein
MEGNYLVTQSYAQNVSMIMWQVVMHFHLFWYYFSENVFYLEQVRN